MHYKLYIKGHIIKFLEKITRAWPAKASFFIKSLSLIRDKSGLEAMLQKIYTFHFQGKQSYIVQKE